MFFRKLIRLLVIIANDAQSAVSIVVLKALGQHVLGTGEQYPLSVQTKEIRTFPHASEAVVIGDQHLFKTPVKSVSTCIQQNLTASVSVPVSHHAAIRAILPPPHLRIPEIKPAAALRQILFIQHRIPLIFFVIHSISHRKALGLYLTQSPVSLPLP